MTPESRQLRARIREEIGRRNRIPFSRFMEMALYTPELGYYTGPREKIGREGDFYTSLDVHPAFGQLVASQVIELSVALPRGVYTVVEMGAGKGLLAHDMLRTIQMAAPALFRRLRYVIVDVSPELVARQKERLAEFSEILTWYPDLSGLPLVEGIFVSNELVDSLAHRQVVMTGEGLKEVFVTAKGEGFREVLAAPSTPEIEAYFQRLGIALPEGYRTEVNLAALDWVRAVGKRLSRGHVLTIDYGYPADVYYRSDRRRGTFLCYHEHKVSENPYARVGLQDMTAHVDFSSVARAGLEVGLRPVGFTDQAHFLVGLGITRLMERILERDGGDPQGSDEFQALRKLMDPNGMGKAFKVLLQEKGVATPALSGFRFSSHSIRDLTESPDPPGAAGSPGG